MGIIWAVGVTKAVVSSEFLSELPRDIIAKIPDLLDETLEAIDKEEVIDDPEARVWVRAFTRADTTPKEFLEKIGIMDWLQNELTQSLDDIGKILRGEMRPKPIMLNLRPLKTALLHPDVNTYIKEVLEKLPPCDEYQTKEWMEAIARGEDSFDDFPPCRPIDADKAVALMRVHYEKEVEDIPDEVNIFNIERRWFFRDSGLDIARWVVSMTYLLFFIPLFFIGLGALIGASSGTGIMRWMGWAALVGGGLTFALSRFTGKAVQWGIGFGPFPYADWDPDVNLPLLEVALEKTGDIALVVLDHFLSTVDSVSGMVAIIGIVLIAISYLSDSGRRPAARPTGAQPSQPAQPTQPTEPEQPAQPSQPSPPTQPEQPAQPGLSGQTDQGSIPPGNQNIIVSVEDSPALEGNNSKPLPPPSKDE
jgi:hypothetical protein